MALDINNLDLFLGKRVKAFRNKMHWPLKTLSMKLGISIQQLHRYETGVNKISASLLYAIAKELKTDVPIFFEGYEDPTKVTPISQAHNNILLIEEDNNDELQFRQALMEYPDKLNLYSYHTGEEAINFFRSLEEESSAHFFPKPDLILLDLMLPVIGGFEVLKDIKRRRTLQNIPVVVFSKNPTHEEMIKSYYLHASGFIHKSFSYPEVKEQLHKTLSYWMNTVVLPD